MRTNSRNDVHLLSPLFSDGRHFLTLGALGLLFSGVFGVFLAATRQFLPQDSAYLGMTGSELCAHGACRILHFMVHDRLSFGGGLISISILYLWLIHFPLREGRAWAWWTLLLSNVAGIGSFFTFLGFGYLDTWHALATVCLVVLFGTGLAMTHGTLRGPSGAGALLFRPLRMEWRTGQGVGRILLFGTAVAMLMGGLVICLVGMTTVFVPQDLEYMGTTRAALNAINPRLIPLIAHDRAGFGGVVLNTGLVLFCCVWHARPSRPLRQAMMLAGAIGFTSAIGIHLVVGYINITHMAPAIVGAVVFAVGLVLYAKNSGRGRAAPFRGWILFDGGCGMCLTLRQRWGPVVEPLGFRLAALQEPWVQQRLALRGEIPEEMKVLTAGGTVIGGADAFVTIARFVWWAWPVWVVGQVPFGLRLLRMLYRPIARNRHEISRVCRLSASGIPVPHAEQRLD